MNYTDYQNRKLILWKESKKSFIKNLTFSSFFIMFIYMGSFAFWYKKKDKSSANLEADIHFNLWNNCGWKDEKPVIDIGFKITNINSSNSISLFCPFKFDGSNIEDLGCKFNTPELLCAIFNEDYICRAEQKTKLIPVSSKKNNNSLFSIYKLDIDKNIEISEFDDGTIITIKTESMPSASDKGDIYFRFRIYGIELNGLIHQYSESVKGIQALFNETYMLDFRYYNIRSLSTSLIEKMNEVDNVIIPIKKLHFLFMTKAYVDVNTSTVTLKKARKLETDIWKNYVNNQDTEDIIAYHFSFSNRNNNQENYIDNAELFLKYSLQKSVFWKYLIFTILLGVLGSNLIGILKNIGTFLIKLLPFFKN